MLAKLFSLDKRSSFRTFCGKISDTGLTVFGRVVQIAFYVSIETLCVPGTVTMRIDELRKKFPTV